MSELKNRIDFIYIFDVKDGLTGNIETAVTLEMVTLRVSKVDSSTWMTDVAEEVDFNDDFIVYVNASRRYTDCIYSWHF